MVHRSNVDRRYTDCFSVVAIRVSLWNFLLRLYACRISRMACPSEVQVGYSHDMERFYSAIFRLYSISKAPEDEWIPFEDISMA